MRSVVRIQSIEVPELIGITLFEALPCLSHYKLSPRLLDQKEDTELEEGTILSQTPAAGQKVKPYQPIFLVVSRKPKQMRTPNFVTLFLEQIKKEANILNLRVRYYALPSVYPVNTCIAQNPIAESLMKDQAVTVYVSDESEQLVLWPNFMGRSYVEISEFLALYGITPHIIHSSNKCDHALSDTCIIVDQRPLAGSIVSLKQHQIPMIQFQIS